MIYIKCSSSEDSQDEVVQNTDFGLHKAYPLPVTKPQKFTKPICPYLCSTFEDFQLEQEFLTTRVFPKLNEFCRSRGTYFAPNHFKNCVRENDQQALGWDLLRLGLNCIENALPFFMCMLGERYGAFRPDDSPLLPNQLSSLSENPHWLDRNYLLAAEGGYKWVLAESNQNCSLVELEIIQAAFLNDSEYCCFYFRQPDHVDALLQNVPPSEKHKVLTRYQSESDVAKLKIEDLKNRIVKRGLSVRYFCSLEELGNVVVEDWKNIVDRLFPPLDLNKFGNMEAYWEQEMHDKFAVSRRQVFCQSEEIKTITEVMTAFADSCTDETHINIETERTSSWKRPLPFDLLKKKSRTNAKYKSILLVHGERGCGKSTLLSNWLEKYETGIHDYESIYHFVGSSQRSFDITTFMRKVIYRMQREALQSGRDCDIGMLTLRDLTDFNYLCNTFFYAITLAPCFLVIDGVDELGATYNQESSFIKDFHWLPDVLPPQCKIIMTSCTCDWTFKALSKRLDVQTVELGAFHDYLRHEYLEERCPDMEKWLSDGNAMDIFEHSRLVQNPLYLNLLVGELNDQTVHNRLEEYLKTYLEESLSIRDLMHHMIRRWIKEMTWSLGTDWEEEGHEAEVLYGWVAESLRLLCVSRNGLTQQDILDCLQMMGYVDNWEVTPYHWTMFRTVLQDILYEKPGGLLSFSHQHIKECLEFSLFGAVTPAAVPLVRSFALVPTIHDLDQKPYHKILADHMTKSHDLDRQLYELPYHLEKSEQMERLKDFITQEKAFSGYVGNGKNSYLKEKKLDLVHYMKKIEAAGFNIVDTCLNVITIAGVAKRTTHVKRSDTHSHGVQPVQLSADQSEDMLGVPVIVTDCDSKVLRSIAEEDSKEELVKSGPSLEDIEAVNMALMHATTRSNSATPRDSVESFTNEGAHNMATVCTRVGQLLYEFGHQETSLNILTIAFHLLFNNFPLSNREQLQMCVILEFMGRLNRVLGNTEEAERHCRRALEYHLETFDDQVDHADNEIITDREASKGRLFKNLGAIIMDESVPDALEDATTYLSEATAIMQDNSREMASIVHYVGLLRVKYEEYARAEACFRQTIQVRQQWYGKEHPMVADSIMELANLLNNEENTRGFNRVHAEKLFRKTLKIREKMLGKEHLKVGLTLFALGRLLKDEDTKTVKREGVECFRRAMDIFVVQLGPSHKITKDASLYFYWLQKNIQMGEYIYGPAKPKDTRTVDRPFSAMSYHDNDLAVLKQSSSLLAQPQRSYKSLADCAYTSRHSIISGKKSLPSSIYFDRRSLSKSTLTRTVEERGEAIRRVSMLPKTGFQRCLSREKYKTVPDDDDDEEAKGKRCGMSFTFERAKADSTAIASQHHAHYMHYFLPRHTTLERFYKSNLSASIQAERRRSAPTKHLRRAPGESLHSANCKSPGPFDICNNRARVTFGPNMSLRSLLGPKKAPRDIEPEMHHKAAWYHIPGHYPTVQNPLLPRRTNPRTIDQSEMNRIAKVGFGQGVVDVPTDRRSSLKSRDTRDTALSDFMDVTDGVSEYGGASRVSHPLVHFVEG